MKHEERLKSEQNWLKHMKSSVTGQRSVSEEEADWTHWKVKGLAKNMKERMMVMAFLPVVTAKK